MDKIKTINFDKLKKWYNNNTEEIYLFIFSFILSSLLKFPIHVKFMISSSLLIKNKVLSTISIIFTMILYFIVGTSIELEIMNFCIITLLLFTIWFKWHSKHDNNYYHNKVIIYCLAIYLSLFSDIILKESFWEFLFYIVQNQTSTITVRAATVFLLVAFLELLLRLPKPKIWFLVISNLYFVLNIVNYWVYMLTKQPFVLSDIGLIKTAKTVLEGVTITPFHIKYFIWILVIIAITDIIFIKFIKFNKPNLSKNAHNKQIIASLLLIMLFFFAIPRLNIVLFSTFEKLGFIGHLCTTVETFDEPVNYENFTDIEKKTITQETNKKKPNVIIIMNEAFSDLSLVSDNFKTSVDYIPYTKSLIKNYPSGIAYSSVFGNNTVSSEFESLTGIPTGLTTKGSIIYQKIIKDETESIVSEFKNNGYKTIGIHPYGNIGYNRGKTWSNFGMNESYFIDSFGKAEKVRDFFISDEAFYDKIIELYEENKDQPLFVYGLSMQNHATYNTEGFESTETNFKQDVNEYITLSNISDKALKKLINYFEKVDEETVILYFGDHQPMIDKSFYEDLFDKPKEEFTNEEVLAQYKIPYVLWSNYDLNIDVPQETSICYLPGILLDSIGFKTSSWFEFVNEMKNKYPILTENFIKEKNGKLLETKTVKDKLDSITNANSNHKFIDLKKYQSIGYQILIEK